MATNELLPFATGAGANIQTQAEYAADAQRSSGNIPGVARSALVNKAIRQSSFAASMIGQFIADQGGINVVDDGDVAGLKTDFIASIRAYLQTQVATTAQAQALTDDTVLITPKKLSDALGGGNQSLTTNGYRKVPGGYIEQWGFATINPDTDTPTNFPIPFPNEVLGVYASNATTITQTTRAAKDGTSLSRFILFRATTSGSIYWRAIGR